MEPPCSENLHKPKFIHWVIDKGLPCRLSFYLSVSLSLCDILVSGIEAFHIASLVRDGGTVYAFGVPPVQLRELQEAMFKLGLESILAHGWTVQYASSMLPLVCLHT